MERTRTVFELDISVIGATIALAVIGILFVYSSGVASDGQVVSREYVRQIVWVGTGIILMIAVTFTDYRIFDGLAIWIYAAALLVLVFTLAFGRVVNGARSWIGVGSFGVQPSEFAKVATIMALARYYRGAGERRTTLIGFLSGGAITALPMVLVLAQPDLGTALVYIPIFLVTAFAAGTRIRYVVFVIVLGTLTTLSMAVPVWQEALFGKTQPWVAVMTDVAVMRFFLIGVGAALAIALAATVFLSRRVFYWVSYLLVLVGASLPVGYLARSVLQDYQVMRLIVFLDPYVDPRGAGWNIIQSVTAVGSGGPFGKGYLRGTQSHYRYLPQQSTDFIFSIIAEEWGFLGSTVLFVLIGVIVYRGIAIMARAKDHFAAFCAAGIVGMIFFHAVVNIGMAVGIMPITGIPLLLVSYGGSSLWTAMFAIGVLLSIHQHRYQY